jgi:replication factor A1
MAAAATCNRVYKWNKRQQYIIDSQSFPSIASLSVSTPPDWVLKVRVVKRYEKRAWQNDRSSGLLMNLDLQDAQGTGIQATLFKDAIDNYETSIHQDHCYLIGNGMIKHANKKFTDQEYSLSFDKMAIFVDVTPDHNNVIGIVNPTPPAFCPVKNIANVYAQWRHSGQDKKCDVIGVVHEIGEKTSI